MADYSNQTASDFLGPLPTGTSTAPGSSSASEFLGPMPNMPQGPPIPPKSNWDYYAKHLPAYVADQLATGVANTLGVPGDVEELVRPYIESKLGPQGAGLPTSEQIRNYTGAGSNTQPENKAEEWGGAALRGLPSMIWAPEVGMWKAAGAAIMGGLGQKAGGDVGASYGPGGQAVGEAIGSVAGGGLSGAREALATSPHAMSGIRNMLAAEALMKIFGLDIPHWAEGAVDLGALLLKDPKKALQAIGPGATVGGANALGGSNSEVEQ